MTAKGVTIHATTVALAGRGILITGPSNTGKSALALQLIALGAVLVADDRTTVLRKDDELVANCPEPIAGLIEARGVGLLSMPCITDVPVVLAVDMAQQEADRLPQRHILSVLGIDLPCLHKVNAPYFPAAIHAYMQGSMESRCDDHP